MNDTENLINNSILYLNYDILVESINSDQLLDKNQSLENKNSVKNKIRYKIGNKLSRKLDSVGSTYLLPFESSVSKKYVGGIFVDNGRQCDDYLFRIPVGIRTIVRPSSKEYKNRIWNQLKEKGSSITIEINRNIQNSNKTYQKGEYRLIFKDPQRYNRVEDSSGENLPSYIPDDEHNTHKIEQELISRGLGDPFGLTEEQVTGKDEIDLSELPDKNPDQIMSNVTEKSVNNIRNTYDEKSTKVRKPTESEFEKILDNLIERLDNISDTNNPIYLEETPDEWSFGTCSRCNEHTRDVNIRLESKAKKILFNQLKEGFGIADNSEEKSRREFVDSDITNLMIDEKGEVYYQPEEVLSWFVDISHYVEPMCTDCHNSVGGSNHTNIISVTTKNKDLDQTELMETSNKQDKNNNKLNLNDDLQPITIDTDDKINNKNHVGFYRPPTDSELEYILDCIAEYTYKLVTRQDKRPTSKSSRRKVEIYNIVHKRKNRHKGRTSELCQCESCNTLIGDGDIGYNDLQRHHSDPKKLQKFKVDLIEKNRDIDRASILVNDQQNDYILKDSFLWRLETFLNNIDTLTIFCDDCEKRLSQNYVEPDNIKEYKQSEIGDDFKNKDTIQNNNTTSIDQNIETQIVETLRPTNPPREMEFNCYKCLEKYTAKNQSHNCYTTLTDQGNIMGRTPIIHRNKLNAEFWDTETDYIGACGTHINTLIKDIKTQIDESDMTENALEQAYKRLISKEVR